MGDITMNNEKCPSMFFRRSDLLQLLCTTALENKNIRIHVNKQLIAVKQHSNEEMQLKFQDGSTGNANLVIGADGVNSVVRKHYVGDAPTFSGRVAYRGIIPIDKIKEVCPTEDPNIPGIWTQEGKHIVTYVFISSRLISKISNFKGQWHGECRGIRIGLQSTSFKRGLGNKSIEVASIRGI